MFDDFQLTSHPWLDEALSAAALAIVATIIHRLATAVSVRVGRRHPTVARLSTYTNHPAQWVLWLASLQFVLQSAPATLPNYAFVRQASSLALIAALTWLGVRIARAATDIV